MPKVTFYLPDSTLKIIDDPRGMVPRSKLIRRIIEAIHASDKTWIPKLIEREQKAQ